MPLQKSDPGTLVVVVVVGGLVVVPSSGWGMIVGGSGGSSGSKDRRIKIFINVQRVQAGEFLKNSTKSSYQHP